MKGRNNFLVIFETVNEACLDFQSSCKESINQVDISETARSVAGQLL